MISQVHVNYCHIVATGLFELVIDLGGYAVSSSALMIAVQADAGNWLTSSRING
jgi:hypothetical protein